MKVLFVGALWQGSTGLQRCVALRDLGHEITEIDALPNTPGLLERTITRLGYQPDRNNVNNAIRTASRHERFDVAWIDKTLSISPQTLRGLKEESQSTILIFFSPDDMMHPRNQTLQYRACIPIYDLHVTTKSYNVAELEKLGAKSVLFVDNSYDPHNHHPLKLSLEEQRHWGADVCFVGGYERDRYEKMLELARSGIEVIIRGPGWKPYVSRHPNLLIEPGWVLGTDYARSICASKVNLGFLRKVARDLQTTRTMEIPACGGFMLAERTDEHCRLFVEGAEAEFFSDVSEMIAKTSYYLERPNERERIAKAGRERCINSGYSNSERLRTVLEYVALPDNRT